MRERVAYCLRQAVLQQSWDAFAWAAEDGPASKSPYRSRHCKMILGAVHR